MKKYLKSPDLGFLEKRGDPVVHSDSTQQELSFEV